MPFIVAVNLLPRQAAALARRRPRGARRCPRTCPMITTDARDRARDQGGPARAGAARTGAGLRRRLSAATSCARRTASRSSTTSRPLGAARRVQPATSGLGVPARRPGVTVLRGGHDAPCRSPSSSCTGTSPTAARDTIEALPAPGRARPDRGGRQRLDARPTLARLREVVRRRARRRRAARAGREHRASARPPTPASGAGCAEGRRRVGGARAPRRAPGRRHAGRADRGGRGPAPRRAGLRRRRRRRDARCSTPTSGA